MSLKAYYLLLFRRAFGHSLGLAEKIELLIGLIAGMLQYFLPPSTHPLLAAGVALAWVIPLLLLLMTWAYRLIISPHRLHLETLAKLPDVNRTPIIQRLAALLTKGSSVALNVTYRGTRESTYYVISWSNDVR